MTVLERLVDLRDKADGELKCEDGFYIVRSNVTRWIVSELNSIIEDITEQRCIMRTGRTYEIR